MGGLGGGGGAADPCGEVGRRRFLVRQQARHPPAHQPGRRRRPRRQDGGGVVHGAHGADDCVGRGWAGPPASGTGVSSTLSGGGAGSGGAPVLPSNAAAPRPLDLGDGTSYMLPYADDARKPTGRAQPARQTRGSRPTLRSTTRRSGAVATWMVRPATPAPRPARMPGCSTWRLKRLPSRRRPRVGWRWGAMVCVRRRG